MSFCVKEFEVCVNGSIFLVMNSKRCNDFKFDVLLPLQFHPLSET